ncbi:hypothetical protein P3X46_029140 [Hevea brasiliensis]|uniref:peroxidase n=1 Tax=Hevea brasiliensis TaxID=3981 RepID=A0ABQ9KUP8_HEVBR|nr:hypothetical protein P3X46_029140 [Hevea brasiliensis]
MKDRTVPAALLRMHFHDCFIRVIIDNAKKEVEALCPGVVSCADILALAARDAVVLSGGPTWDVPKGRKDGRTSKASETIQLPAPRFNISQLQQSFFQRGLSMDDLVAFSEYLPKNNNAKNAGSPMDPSSTTLDNTYFKLILQRKTLFSSDQALRTNAGTKVLVSKFASSQDAFYKAFVKSMIKMSSNTAGQEVRKDCRLVN